MSVFIESCWSHILGEQTCVLGIVAEHTVRLLPPHHSPTSHWEAADRFHGDLSVHQAFGEQPNVLQHLLLSHPVLCQCSPQTSTILSSDPCVQVQKPLMHHSFVLLQSNSFQQACKPVSLRFCLLPGAFFLWSSTCPTSPPWITHHLTVTVGKVQTQCSVTTGGLKPDRISGVEEEIRGERSRVVVPQNFLRSSSVFLSSLKPSFTPVFLFYHRRRDWWMFRLLVKWLSIISQNPPGAFPKSLILMIPHLFYMLCYF